MTRTQIYLPEQRIEYFRQRAYEEKTTMSEVIRRLLEDCIDNKRFTKPLNAGETLLKLSELGKKYKAKAPRDLASKLDKYLYGEQ